MLRQSHTRHAHFYVNWSHYTANTWKVEHGLNDARVSFQVIYSLTLCVLGNVITGVQTGAVNGNKWVEIRCFVHDVWTNQSSGGEASSIQAKIRQVMLWSEAAIRLDDRDVHCCHSVPNRSLDGNQGSQCARPPPPSKQDMLKDGGRLQTWPAFFCKTCQRAHFSFPFSSWMCGNQGCSDDSECGIIWSNQVAPLFTLIDHLDGGDLFGLGGFSDFDVWQCAEQEEQQEILRFHSDSFLIRQKEKQKTQRRKPPMDVQPSLCMFFCLCLFIFHFMSPLSHYAASLFSHWVQILNPGCSSDSEEPMVTPV